jgi:hypothetical protein
VSRERVALDVGGCEKSIGGWLSEMKVFWRVNKNFRNFGLGGSAVVGQHGCPKLPRVLVVTGRTVHNVNRQVRNFV